MVFEGMKGSLDSDGGSTVIGLLKTKKIKEFAYVRVAEDIPIESVINTLELINL